jgi:hypothetical protein
VFWGSIYNALVDDGTLVMQVGGTPSIIDPGQHLSRDCNRAAMLETIQNVGFKIMHIYVEVSQARAT